MLFSPLYFDPPGLEFVSRASVINAWSDTHATLRQTGQQAAAAFRAAAEQHPEVPLASLPAYAGRAG